MASTRNNNTFSDYCLQQRSYNQSRDWISYKHGSYGNAYRNAIPCLGYTPSHMPWNTLSYNPVEIESQLYGINSTNLVNPQAPIRPQLKSVPMIPYFSRIPLIKSPDLPILRNQRPFPVPN